MKKIVSLFFVLLLLLFAEYATAAPITVVDKCLSVTVEGPAFTAVYTMMLDNESPCDVDVTMTCGMVDDDDNFIAGYSGTYTETIHAWEFRVISGTFVFDSDTMFNAPYEDFGCKSEWNFVEGCLKEESEL